jgi:epoxyqueuosine reductase
MDPSLLSKRLKRKGYELGFDFVGIAKAEFLEKEAKDLEKWLSMNHHGQMTWMENHFDKRVDPRKLLEGAKSIISFGLNYFPEERQSPDTYKISKYAYGKDYHKVLKKKLKEIIKFLYLEVGHINARAFVDSAPVMDKAWAKRSGLGWLGKHTNLISKQIGSFFFIGEIICDINLEYDSPIKDYCGTCTKCLDACPTNALYEPYKIDGSKCISYLTIELKNAIPSEFNGKMEDWIFGCDICQDVCPWNSKSVFHSNEEFNPNKKMLGYNSKDWEEITEEVFSEVFQSSAFKRTKFEGLKRNIEFVQSKSPENSGLD